MPVGVPTLGVRQRQPTHERGKISILARPNHQVPMIRHHAIGQQTHLHSPHRVGEDLLERFVVFRLVKDAHPGIGPVQHVVHQPAGNNSFCSSHAAILRNTPLRVNNGSWHLLYSRAVPAEFFGSGWEHVFLARGIRRATDSPTADSAVCAAAPGFGESRGGYNGQHLPCGVDGRKRPSASVRSGCPRSYPFFFVVSGRIALRTCRLRFHAILRRFIRRKFLISSPTCW
jgi:hypothetical protein